MSESEPEPRGTAKHIMFHVMPKGAPATELTAPKFTVTPADVELAGRVMRAFYSAMDAENAMRPESVPNDGIWETMKNVFHGEFRQALFEKNVTSLAEILVDAQRRPITHGLGPGAQVFAAFARNESAKAVGGLLADRFVSFAEALGVLWYENPEQGRWGVNLYEDLGRIRALIEKAMGISIAMPECCGVFGIRVGDAVISTRTCDNLYTSWRIGDLLDNRKNIHVCEIGAGMGGNAYYCLKRGLASYTIIDLPVMNVLQGFILAKTCGTENVVLYGENGGGAIRVMPYWMIEDVPDKKFDLVLNQDSMPEIQKEHVEGYIKQIRRTTKKYFLSINQEGEEIARLPDLRQVVVAELVLAQPGYRRRYRFPYWIRKGYIEELYEIIP